MKKSARGKYWRRIWTKANNYSTNKKNTNLVWCWAAQCTKFTRVAFWNASRLLFLKRFKRWLKYLCSNPIEFYVQNSQNTRFERMKMVCVCAFFFPCNFKCSVRFSAKEMKAQETAMASKPIQTDNARQNKKKKTKMMENLLKTNRLIWNQAMNENRKAAVQSKR